MKSLPIIALSAAVAVLCSCSEISPKFAKDQAIKFVVNAESLTKGEVTDIKNLNQFKVTAVTGETNYFTDMVVTSNDQGKTWNVSDTYYWPDYDIAFFAYANENGKVKINGMGQKIEGYSVPQDIDQQKDFVVAYNKGNVTNNAEKGVQMAFQHATAGIRVRALASNSNYIVKVYGVKIGNLRGTDNFTFPAGKIDGANWEGFANSKHDAEKTVSNYQQLYSTPIVLTTESQLVTVEGTNLFLIPQNRDKWKATKASENTAENQGSYISLLVNITTKDGTPVYPKSASYEAEGVNAAWDAVGVDFELNPGTVNTYTIKFFGNGGAGQQDPIKPEDDGKGGDPILQGAVMYEVSVEDWTDGGNSNIDMK